MDLKNAIIRAKQKFGIEIVYEPRIIAILDDYGVFRYNPSFRFIIMQLIKIKEIRNYANASDEQRRMIIRRFINKFGFNESLVQEVFESFWNNNSESLQKEDYCVTLYNKVAEFKDGIFAVRDNGKWGWMGINGNIAIVPKYNWVSSFVDGLAKFSTKGYWEDGIYHPLKEGCIDFLGNVIIPEEYENIRLSRYKNDVIFVKKNGKFGMLDKHGKIIIPCKYDDITECGNNIFRTKIITSDCNGNEKKKYGIVLISGRVLCEPIYDFVWGGSFSEGHPYAIVRNDTEYLVLDDSNHYISSFHGKGIVHTKCNNLFVLRTEGPKYGIISIDGSIIIATIYEKIIVDTDIIIAQSNNVWYIFTIFGSRIDAPRLVYAFLHNNAVYGKTQDGRCVKISEDGTLSILPLAEIHYVFENGLIAGTMSEQSWLYNNLLVIYNPMTSKYKAPGIGGYFIEVCEINTLTGYIKILEQGELSDYYFFNTKNGNMFFHYGNNGCGTFGWTTYGIGGQLQNISIMQQKRYSAEGVLDEIKYFIVDTETSNKVGLYKDTNGEIKRRYFDSISSFKFGFSVCKINEKYGYLNEKGDIAIPSRFSYAESFNDKFAIISENGFYNIIDKSGKTVLDKRFEMIQNIQYPIDYGNL